MLGIFYIYHDWIDLNKIDWKSEKDLEKLVIF